MTIDELDGSGDPDASDASDALPPAEAEPGAAEPRTTAGPRGLHLSLRRLRLAAWPVYLVALGWYLYNKGVPLSNDVILAWLMGALLAAAAAHGGNPLKVLRDWLPVAVALYTYSLLRGYAGHPWFMIHWGPQVRIDKALGFGTTWTNRLQHHFLDADHPSWWDYVAWSTYMSHFFTIFIVLAVLWRTRYQRFKQLIGCYLVLTFAGYATYVLYPADPPWIAGQDHHMPAVGRLIGPMFGHVGLPLAQSVFERGSQFDNEVAAMPSLHSAYPVLLLLFFWPVANRWVRALLVLYPLMMATTLVYSGEHFVVDILAGWTYAAVVYFGVTRLMRWWAVRKATPARARVGAKPLADAVV